MFQKIFHQSSAERITMMTEGNIYKTFLFMSIPGILLAVITATMPILDGLLVFNYADAVSGAAISFCLSMQNIFIMGIMGLTSAGSALIGNANGNREFAKARALAGQLLSISVIVGVAAIPVLILLGFLLSITATGEMREKIIIYNSLLSLSLPFVACQSAFNSIKGVFGHPESIFFRALLFLPLKLFFTILFVVHLRMGVVGAALSAVFAYAAITIFMIYDMFIRNSDEKLVRKDLKPERAVLKKFSLYSWPSVLQNSTKSIGFFLIKNETLRYGDTALSGMVIGGDLNGMFQLLTACYDATIISFVSVNIGAGKPERAKKAANIAVFLGVVTSVIFTVIAIVFGPALVRMYTSDPEIIEVAVRANAIMALGFVGFAVMFNEMPAFIGLGLNKISLLIQTMRIWVVRLIAMYAMYWLIDGIGVDAVFFSMTAANITGGLISHLLFRRIKWSTKEIRWFRFRGRRKFMD